MNRKEVHRNAQVVRLLAILRALGAVPIWR